MKKVHSGLTLLSLLMFLTAFTVKEKELFKLPKSIHKDYVFMPMGDAVIAGETTFSPAFFISKYEVTNAQYGEFLKALKAEGRNDDLAIAMIDSAQWVNASFQNEPYIQYYHSHPAYAEYPVVNITGAGAELYCNWLAAKLNAENAESAFTIAVRLPSRTEWIHAANANLDSPVYAWDGYSLRDSKGKALCNYNTIGDGSIYFDEATSTYQVKNETDTYMNVAGYLSDNADITCPVTSYTPNAFGIYNLNGNVAEMTTDDLACGGSWKSPGYDVRNESTIAMDDAKPTVGFRPILTMTMKN